MRSFLVFSLIYLAASLAVVWLRHGDIGGVLAQAAAVSVDNFWIMKALVVWFVPVVLVLPLVLSMRDLRARASEVFCAAVGCLALQIGFTFMKSSIPHIMPFYADPFFAELDRVLHAGIDPWRIAHGAVPPAAAQMFLPVYLQLWSIPAVTLPVLIALSDDDAGRVRRFVGLYLFAWLGLGNVFAVLGSSVGPVFYDALLGGNRFAAMQAALAESGVSSSIVGQVQNYLWTAYETQGMSFGSGISAFPSVHLGIAMTTALYLAERSRYLVPVGAVFVAIILFLSVYTGYHYAVDGYFSIAVIGLAWIGLRQPRRSLVPAR